MSICIVLCEIKVRTFYFKNKRYLVRSFDHVKCIVSCCSSSCVLLIIDEEKEKYCTFSANRSLCNQRKTNRVCFFFAYRKYLNCLFLKDDFDKMWLFEIVVIQNPYLLMYPNHHHYVKQYEDAKNKSIDGI